MDVGLEIIDDIATITLDAPQSMNAITLDAVERLRALLPEVERSARAMVLTGANGHFCSGANLKSASSGSKNDAGYRLETHFNPLMSDLRALSVPWISVVPGAAAGVGCALALSADMILAAEDAYFLMAFRRIGLVPDGGSAFLLAHGAGRVRAMEMMLLGERIPAVMALEWGLINRCLPGPALAGEAARIAAKLATGPTRSLAMTRQLCWEAAEQSHSATLALERRLQGEAGLTDDYVEGVSAFRDKRPARFTGR